MAVRTEALHAGNAVGTGKAAVALSGMYVEIDKLGAGIRWLARAREELGEEYAPTVEQNMHQVLLYVEEAYESELLCAAFGGWKSQAEQAVSVKSSLEKN